MKPEFHNRVQNSVKEVMLHSPKTNFLRIHFNIICLSIRDTQDGLWQTGFSPKTLSIPCDLCDVISFSLICNPCIGGARCSCGTGLCIVVMCLLCWVMGFCVLDTYVLWVVYCLPCVVYCWNVHIAVFTLDAGPLARCQCPEGPATDHIDTGFLSWFPCVLKANA